MMQTALKKQSLLRSIVILVLLAILADAAMFLSIAFRYEGNLSPRLLDHLRVYFYYLLLVFTPCFILFNLHEMPWRYTGLRMAFRIVSACITATAIMLLLGWIFHWRILRSILCLTGIFSCVFIFCARLAWRNFRRLILREDDLIQKRVLIIGAGALGVRAYQMCLQGEMPIKGIRHTPVAFVDNDLDVIFRNVCGISVEGGYEDIPKIIESQEIHEIILAVSGGNPVLLGQIIQRCKDSVREIPIFIIAEYDGMTEVNKQESGWQIRSLLIGDLFFNDTLSQEVEGIREVIDGQTVMVTGGAGSMGSELCRQIMRYNPAQIVVLDVNENAMSQMFDEVSNVSRDKLAIALDSIMDHERLEAVFARYLPKIVFHAAGYKNRLTAENCAEAAVRNNIMGINNVLEAAEKNGAEFFVHLSSDQALEPKTPVGVIKRIEEMSVQTHSGRTMRCISVRFGNTLDAYGGIVSRINMQIDHGGPVHICDPDSQRSFIPVRAAARGILEAVSKCRAKDNDGYALCALNMRRPIRIRNLAETLIRLRGYTPGKDIVIRIPEGQVQAESAQGDAETDPAAIMDDGKRDRVVFTSFDPVDAAQLRTDLERLRLALPDRCGNDIYRILYDIAGAAGIYPPSGSVIPYNHPARFIRRLTGINGRTDGEEVSDVYPDRRSFTDNVRTIKRKRRRVASSASAGD